VLLKINSTTIKIFPVIHKITFEYAPNNAFKKKSTNFTQAFFIKKSGASVVGYYPRYSFSDIHWYMSAPQDCKFCLYTLLQHVPYLTCLLKSVVKFIYISLFCL